MAWITARRLRSAYWLAAEKVVIPPASHLLGLLFPVRLLPSKFTSSLVYTKTVKTTQKSARRAQFTYNQIIFRKCLTTDNESTCDTTRRHHRFAQQGRRIKRHNVRYFTRTTRYCGGSSIRSYSRWRVWLGGSRRLFHPYILAECCKLYSWTVCLQSRFRFCSCSSSSSLECSRLLTMLIPSIPSGPDHGAFSRLHF